MKEWFNNLTFLQRKIIATIIVAIGFVFILVGGLEDLALLSVLGFAILAFAFILVLNVEKAEKKEKEKQEELKKLEESRRLQIQIEQNERAAEEKRKELESIKEHFIIPEGKKVSYTRTITTRVRGVYYQDIYEYEINLDDEVFIRHVPTEQYEESAEICLRSNGTLLGYLKEDIANEFVEKFGEGYCFIGAIVDYEMVDDEEDEEDKIGKIIISFDIPSFKKA